MTDTVHTPTEGARMLRHEVPVDDQWHLIHVPGRYLHDPAAHVGCRRSGRVEFWVRENLTPTEQKTVRAYRVYGTGHTFPLHARYEGTTPDEHQALIWHLVSVPAGDPATT